MKKLTDDETRVDYFLTKPRKVKDGLKASNRKEERKWWVKKWINDIETLESGNRFKQGRYFAKQGQVVYIKIQKGFAVAKVQDSKLKPYSVRIEVDTIPDNIWIKIIDEIGTKAYFSAKLLSNDLHEEINDVFKKYNVSLFPEVRGGDLRAACNCTDWANPCKHTAAVLYILGEQFEEEPLLYFKMRGKTKEEILTIIREKQAITGKEDVIILSRKKEGLNRNQLMEQIEQDGENKETIKLLEKLGPSPFISNNENFINLLSKVYKVASEIATKKRESK
ncbi:MAG: hypothetical protein FK733_10605 [Asgard group archaeon]|nr:hypothetical protein [Asgard group archaeon]